MNSNSNFVSPDQDDVTAAELFASELGNFGTREREDFLADQFERRAGRILRRTWEVQCAACKDAKKPNPKHADCVRGAESYAARLRRIRLGEKPVAKTLSMDPPRARRTLEDMERAERKRPRIEDEEPRQQEKRREDWKYMNQLRAALGMDVFDYAAEEIPSPLQEAAERYAEFQKRRLDADDRRVAAQTLEDIELLRLLMGHDASPEVRQAAEVRYGQLLVGAR